MSVVTLEGVVHNGTIQLATNVRLPENAKVYVIIPEIKPEITVERIGHIVSPHLVHPEQAKDFQLEIVEEDVNASL